MSEGLTFEKLLQTRKDFQPFIDSIYKSYSGFNVVLDTDLPQDSHELRVGARLYNEIIRVTNES